MIGSLCFEDSAYQIPLLQFQNKQKKSIRFKFKRL